MARLVIKRIKEMDLLEQPMVVVNVPGGAATIGMRQAKSADADGHTLLYIHQTMMTLELMGTLDFSYTDMVPVAETNFSCLLTATAEGSGVTDAQDWIDHRFAGAVSLRQCTSLRGSRRPDLCRWSSLLQECGQVQPAAVPATANDADARAGVLRLR